MFYPFSQELGRNFVDPVPLDVLPAVAETGDRLAGTSAISKSQTSTALPGVSSGFVDVYEEYVPRLVPRGPRSVSKRGRTMGLHLACQSPRSLANQVLPQVLQLLLACS